MPASMAKVAGQPSMAVARYSRASRTPMPLAQPPPRQKGPWLGIRLNHELRPDFKVSCSGPAVEEPSATGLSQQPPSTISSSSSTSSSSIGSSIADASMGVIPSADGATAALQAEAEMENRVNLYKAVGVGAAVSILAGILDHSLVEAHQELAMGAVFCVGYLFIVVEEILGFNKAAVALLMAVSLWVIRSTGGDTQIEAEVSASLAQVSELIFFLLGAMTVVEVVDTHDGFKQLAAAVRTDDRRSLAWLVAFSTFGLSAVLDNLTTTIVVLSLLQRLVPKDDELRMLLGAITVVAANAGGAWTPIGDVTTTMLWIHGQVTPGPTMRDLFIPSLVSVLVPLVGMSWRLPALQGPVLQASSSSISSADHTSSRSNSSMQPTASLGAISAPAAAGGHIPAAESTAAAKAPKSNRGPLVLYVGVGSLVSVPIFKYVTGLPPYMGMLTGLAVLWLLTDALHFGEDKQYPRVQDALKNLDIGGVMFFFGILMAVEALNTAGLLHDLAQQLNEVVPNVDIIAAVIGMVSALIDNVPLVAATMGMYDLAQVPVDSQLWQLVALCAGTGGSLLVIGSAAGVAFMSMEGAGFGWYARTITPWVFAGYAASILAYVAAHGLPGAGSA